MTLSYCYGEIDENSSALSHVLVFTGARQSGDWAWLVIWYKYSLHIFCHEQWKLASSSYLFSSHHWKTTNFRYLLQLPQISVQNFVRWEKVHLETKELTTQLQCLNHYRVFADLPPFLSTSNPSKFLFITLSRLQAEITLPTIIILLFYNLEEKKTRQSKGIQRYYLQRSYTTHLCRPLNICRSVSLSPWHCQRVIFLSITSWL